MMTFFVVMILYIIFMTIASIICLICDAMIKFLTWLEKRLNCE